MASGRSKYSLFNRINFDDLYNAFLGLDDRQQLLTVAGAVFAVILLIVLPISWASSTLSSLEKDYSKARQGFDQVQTKIGDYQKSKLQLDALKKQLKSRKGGSLSAVIESIAKDAGVEISRVKKINLAGNDYYDLDAISAEVEQESLENIKNFLYKVENYPDLPLKFKKLEIKTSYRARHKLTARFQVATINLK